MLTAPYDLHYLMQSSMLDPCGVRLCSMITWHCKEPEVPALAMHYARVTLRLFIEPVGFQPKSSVVFNVCPSTTDTDTAVSLPVSLYVK